MTQQLLSKATSKGVFGTKLEQQSQLAAREGYMVPISALDWCYWCSSGESSTPM